MNIPKAIETAIGTVLREFGGIPNDVAIRMWQTLDKDKTQADDVDRTFPQIDVRCAPAKTDENQCTQSCDCSVLVATSAHDDKDHSQISYLYELVQGVLDRLFSQFRKQSPGDELNRFNDLMAANAPAGSYEFGGFTFGEALAPSTADSTNMIGTTLTVHYGRDDF